MGSLEKTVKVATCFSRWSTRLSSSSPSARPLLRLERDSRSSSNSPTPHTTWPSSEELLSSKPSPPELSRDLAASEVTATRPTAERRAETGDLMMEMMVVTTHHPPLPPLLPLPPPLHHHLHQPLRHMLPPPQLLQCTSRPCSLQASPNPRPGGLQARPQDC